MGLIIVPNLIDDETEAQRSNLYKATQKESGRPGSNLASLHLKPVISRE